jgi:hypothetical protein
MKVYNYHPEHKHFLNEEDAHPSPLEPGQWLFPANSTIIAPPKPKANKVAIWNESKQKWTMKTIPKPKEEVIVNYCPLIGRECIKSSCAWYVDEKCAITSLAHLLKTKEN